MPPLIKTEADFTAQVAQSQRPVVAHFRADWCQPCAQMDLVMDRLATKYRDITFVGVDTESVPELADKFGVAAVPTFVLYKGGAEVVGRVDGANAAELSRLVEALNKVKPNAPSGGCGSAQCKCAAKRAAAAAAGGSSTDDDRVPAQSLHDRLRSLINQAPIMLFLKGTPNAPRCGFSAAMVNLLNEQGIQYDHFNILEDDEVRQGLKSFSNWPTYPQLYAGGRLIGGLDIAKEMVAEDELVSTINSMIEESQNSA